jgi:carbon monoxide dehydrogenase subunit G
MAIQLHNRFDLELPPERAWTLLTDIERIAPCVPGAKLTEAQGDEYRGSIKLRLGPISAEYRGAGVIKETDAAARRMVVEGKGRDVHGQGAASAVMVVTLVAEGAGSRIDVVTEVQVAGKMAQLGKSMMQDVASRLIDQFVVNLRQLLADMPPEDEATPAAEVEARAAAAPAEPEAEALRSEPLADAPVTPAARPIVSAEAKPIDLLGAAAVRRWLWIAAAAVVAVVAIALVAVRR